MNKFGLHLTSTLSYQEMFAIIYNDLNIFTKRGRLKNSSPGQKN